MENNIKEEFKKLNSLMKVFMEEVKINHRIYTDSLEKLRGDNIILSQKIIADNKRLNRLTKFCYLITTLLIVILIGCMLKILH